ncbi:MAG: hypothetical protein GY811_10415 [Myxococcales bacterium]|nr:hypothetical protein [Myxococcales bacterium]
MNRRQQRKRRLLIVLASISLCVGVLSARALWEGRSALQAGDAALAEGDSAGAVRWWRRAARWYLPMAPHVGTAYDKLRGLAATAEERGEPQVAIAAWTGIRSSVRATRSFYTPYSDRLTEADAHIAKLMAQAEFDADTSKNVKEAEDWHLALLGRDQMPSVGWSIIALLGMALWIGGGFAFALRGVDENDRLVPKAAAYSGAAVALGLLTWLLGLHWA